MIITIEREGIEHKTALSDDADYNQLLSVVKMIAIFGLGYNFGDEKTEKIIDEYNDIRNKEKKGLL